MWLCAVPVFFCTVLTGFSVVPRSSCAVSYGPEWFLCDFAQFLCNSVMRLLYKVPNDKIVLECMNQNLLNVV